MIPHTSSSTHAFSPFRYASLHFPYPSPRGIAWLKTFNFQCPAINPNQLADAISAEIVWPIMGILKMCSDQEYAAFKRKFKVSPSSHANVYPGGWIISWLNRVYVVSCWNILLFLWNVLHCSLSEFTFKMSMKLIISTQPPLNSNCVRPIDKGGNILVNMDTGGPHMLQRLLWHYTAYFVWRKENNQPLSINQTH